MSPFCLACSLNWDKYDLGKQSSVSISPETKQFLDYKLDVLKMTFRYNIRIRLRLGNKVIEDVIASTDWSTNDTRIRHVRLISSIAAKNSAKHKLNFYSG